tara:strand:- start:493 stop:867 length:375 start_codon:yes stop_codon:yes gene_type:complete
MANNENYSENEFSDDSEDEESEIPLDIQAELLENENIVSIMKFKEYIIRQPIFIGINNISSNEILNIIKNNVNSRTIKKELLDNYEVELFDDLYICLFGKKETQKIYEIATSFIMDKCYVRVFK